MKLLCFYNFPKKIKISNRKKKETKKKKKKQKREKRKKEENRKRKLFQEKFIRFSFLFFFTKKVLFEKNKFYCINFML